MTEQVEVTVKFKVDAQELWDAVFGSGALTFSWWTGVEYMGEHMMRVYGEDPNDEGKTVNEVVTPRDLAKAVSAVIEKGYVDACTGRPITLSPGDIDFDACVGDVILQQAVFDEVIYS